MDFWKWIVKTVEVYFGLDNLGNPQGWLNLIFGIITLVMGLLLFYRFIYTIMGLFGKSRTYEKKPEDYRYCFILSARNEEKVIGNLIDSIHGWFFLSLNLNDHSRSGTHRQPARRARTRNRGRW